MPIVPLRAATLSAGTLIKGSGPAVYYYTKAGTRLSFPNEKTYFTWYADFSNITTITDAELAAITLSGNVTYRPGARMIKIQSDPRVYAVDDGGTLRWVQTEQLATSLYGADWAKKIDDLSDAFFSDYQTGLSITSASDFSPSAVQTAHPSIETTATVVTDDKGIVGTTSVLTGEIITIALTENASTGYSWTATYDMSALSLLSTSSSYPDTGLVGSPGTVTFRFKALSAGQEDIVFNYARPWETGVAPIERRTYRVTITDPITAAANSIATDHVTAQAGSSITIIASSTATPVPAMIAISVGTTEIKTCAQTNLCTTAYAIPSSGADGSYAFTAIFTAQNGTTSTKSVTVPIVAEQQMSSIELSIARPVMRTTDEAEITVRPGPDLNARSITIYIDGVSRKICESSPTVCVFEDPISGSIGSVHTVEAVIRTQEDLFYRSLQKTITLSDNDAPSITIEASKSSMYATETVELTLRANDDDGISSTKILRNGSLLATCSGPAACTVTAGPFSLPSGSTVSFDGVATDLLGLTATSTGLGMITIR
jgi:predicted secreted protein